MPVRSFRVPAALAAIALAFLAGPALSQQSGGVRVKGNTNINVTAKDVNTLAAGQNNTAETYIGSITQDTAGKTNVTVDVKNVENIVTGRGQKGCVSIGSKGACQ